MSEGLFFLGGFCACVGGAIEPKSVVAGVVYKLGVAVMLFSIGAWIRTNDKRHSLSSPGA